MPGPADDDLDPIGGIESVEVELPLPRGGRRIVAAEEVVRAERVEVLLHVEAIAQRKPRAERARIEALHELALREHDVDVVVRDVLRDLAANLKGAAFVATGRDAQRRPSR